MSRRLLQATADHAIRSVSLRHGVPLADMLSWKRGKALIARQYAMWLLRQDGYSLPQIGKAFGRDHSSVYDACKAVDARNAALRNAA